MRFISIVLLLVGCSGVPEIGESEEAAIGGTTGRILPPPPQYLYLSVDSVDGPVVERRPVYVHFTLNNQTSKTHTGNVHATVPQTDGSTMDSNWFQISLAPGASVQGVVEFDAPDPGANVPYSLHYYESTALSTPAESTASSFVLAVAIRTVFYLEELFVVAPADPSFGDNDTAFLQTTKNGTLIDSQSSGLGHLMPFSYTYPELMSPMVDLIPGTSDQVTFNAWIHLQPNWPWGQSATPAQRTVTFTADLVRQMIGGEVITGDTSPIAEEDDYFCNGYLDNQGCPNGYSDYRLTTGVRRMARFADTILLDQHVAQIRTDESFLLDRHVIDDSAVTWLIADGPGTMSNGAYQPPLTLQNGRALVRIVGVDPKRRTSTVYIDVRSN
jgi:hypothetical protein